MEPLPPPPSRIPPAVVPIKAEDLKGSDPPKILPVARAGFGRDGRPVKLLANHFHVTVGAQDAVFYQYNVSMKYEDNQAVLSKVLARKAMNSLFRIYTSELEGKQFAYDGEKSFYTVGALPQNKFEFTVLVEESSARATGGSSGGGSPKEGDQKRSRESRFSKTVKIEISYAAKIPLNAVTVALRGRESEHKQDALRVLDTILRQHQEKRCGLLVKQSFFSDHQSNLVDLGGGLSSCRGFCSSFRATHGGLSLNMDVTSTIVITPGPVKDFLLANQNVRDLSYIDWVKAKKTLKNLRIRYTHSKKDYRIIGLSEKKCNEQLFAMRNGGSQGQTTEVTVSEYFAKRYHINLRESANFPCLAVGRPRNPIYLPLEFCHLLPLQRYTKAVTSQQRASLVEKSRQKPQERKQVVIDHAVKNNWYEDDLILASCGIRIDKQLMQLDGRVLGAPNLLSGNSEEIVPHGGRWTFNKRFFDPKRIQNWAIVNFSTRFDLNRISRDLINCARSKGVIISPPSNIFQEDRRWANAGAVIRVERMVEMMQETLPGRPPQFLLCVLAERKNSPIYGPWKRKNLQELGVINQCICPTKMSDQYFSNLLLKINTKLGGVNSLLVFEHRRTIPLISNEPTMILGMDVSHGPPGRADIPSIAAVVGSLNWPWISRYRAALRAQSSKVEMIESLYKPVDNGKEDDGMIRDLLMDFYRSSGYQKPSHMIIFRDGVSETQFSKVLDVELNQIKKVFDHLREPRYPKFTVIVAQKSHHTRFFLPDTPAIMVPPGTVVDTTVVDPRNYDFYMCPHAGLVGTSRPTHYHVLLDEVGFSADDLQKTIHCLSYVFQRSTTAISIVSPIAYAHLAAEHMSKVMRFDELSETSSGQEEWNVAAGLHPVPELPRIHDRIRRTMFFC